MSFESECTIVIPVRIDTPDRLANLNASIYYLRVCYPSIKIIVVESDATRQIVDTIQFTYYFISTSERFARGRTINDGVKLVTTPYLIVYDCDVFLNRFAVITGWEHLKRDQHVVLPHNCVFVNITGETRLRLHKLIIKDFNKILTNLIGIHHKIDNDLASLSYKLLSGVVMFRTTTYLQLGGFNKKMISYGYEDQEIISRFDKMGYRYMILPHWNVFHIDHRRGIDSRINELYKANKAECDRVGGMPQDRLRQYINDELLPI